MTSCTYFVHPEEAHYSKDVEGVTVVSVIHTHRCDCYYYHRQIHALRHQLNHGNATLQLGASFRAFGQPFN
jgi:hypothetical protein